MDLINNYCGGHLTTLPPDEDGPRATLPRGNILRKIGGGFVCAPLPLPGTPAAAVDVAGAVEGGIGSGPNADAMLSCEKPALDMSVRPLAKSFCT